MTLTCHDATLALGAYVVGALDPRERADVEAHLGHCPMCRDELALLAPLPGLLSRLTIEEAVTGPPPVDDAMLERLLGSLAGERRVASHRRWLAAAAAVVVLAGGTTAGVAMFHSMNATHWQHVSASAGPIHMGVDIEPGATGTALQLSLRGVPSGERCRLVAIADDGSRDFAGSWEATYSGTAKIRSITSIPRDHLRRLVIETYDGTQLVSAAVPTA
ncbi:MAG TPA: zf-HC2 domain-containing protein [Mycobacteriales bacterium]|nr:zf-HC2 domain-containing protein [Mycobacteriales bacterium]